MSGRNQPFVGVVRTFDPVVGLGTIEGPSDQTVGFHAVAIADGSRRIGVGADVRAHLRPGTGGEWEATSVELITPSFPCPVCRQAVDGEPDAYEICPCCGWEDDPVQSADPSYAGGANGSSLDEARAAWLSLD